MPIPFLPHPSKNIGGLAAVEGARAVRFLCDAHQTVVRPADTVQGVEVARHDVKNVRPWQSICGFVEDLRRQLFVLDYNIGVSWCTYGGTR